MACLRWRHFRYLERLSHSGLNHKRSFEPPALGFNPLYQVGRHLCNVATGWGEAKKRDASQLRLLIFIRKLPFL